MFGDGVNTYAPSGGTHRLDFTDAQQDPLTLVDRRTACQRQQHTLSARSDSGKPFSRGIDFNAQIYARALDAQAKRVDLQTADLGQHRNHGVSGDACVGFESGVVNLCLERRGGSKRAGREQE